MPIHSEILLDGQTFRQLEIVPGVPYILKDFQDLSSPKLISIHCNYDENGGIIFTENPKPFNASKPPRKLHLIGRDDDKIEAIIGPGEKYEKEITLHLGLARLILQHYL